MSGKEEGRPGRNLELVNAVGARAEILASYWLEEGTSADLVMATRQLLLPLLKALGVTLRLISFF
jgi:hypothetical protein